MATLLQDVSLAYECAFEDRLARLPARSISRTVKYETKLDRRAFAWETDRGSSGSGVVASPHADTEAHPSHAGRHTL